MDCKYQWPRLALLGVTLACACGEAEAPAPPPPPPSAEENRIYQEREARAAARAADHAAAVQAEAARLERVAQQAPETAASWHLAIMAARQRIESGRYEAGDETSFSVPLDCPTSLVQCEEVAREAAAARESVMPLVEWMAAVANLQAIEPEVSGGGVLQQSTLDGWMELVQAAQSRPDPCPTAVCSRSRVGAVSRIAASVARREMAVPIPVASVSQMQLLYADLRESGRPVEMANASLSAATYYNCAYRSSSDWRAFQIPDGYGPGLYVYCRRGEATCEERYTRAMQGELRGQTVRLQYPRRNPICEADQAEWLTGT